MGKGSVRTSLVFLLVAFLVLFGVASLIAYLESEGFTDQVTGNVIIISNSNTIRVPDSHQPVPNEDEGTIVLWTKPPVEIFDQFSDARDYIIFYSSTNLPGVRIVYNMKEHMFEAGSPLLRSPEIDIFDGQNHQLAYTFKKGAAQSMFLDGQLVNTSDFRPLSAAQITGFTIMVPSISEVDIAGVEVAAYDRQLTPEYI